MYWLSLIFIHFSCKIARIGLMTGTQKVTHDSWNLLEYCKIQRSINQQTRWLERARNGICSLNHQFESINRIRGGYSLQNVITYSLIVPRCQDLGAPKYSMCFDESILVTIRETHLQDESTTHIFPILSHCCQAPSFIFVPHVAAKLHEHLLLATYPQDLPHWASGQAVKRHVDICLVYHTNMCK